MRLPAPVRIVLASASVALFIAACGDDDGASTQSTQPAGNAGAAGQPSGGAAGAAGVAGAATAGSGGTTAGAAGAAGSATAGAAGSANAGAAGSATAGAGGASAGAGGATAGAGGATAGGAGSSGGGGQAMAAPQCGGALDTCKLHDDCCSCVALGPNEQPPACDTKVCKASACELLGKVSTACNAGQCTLSPSCGAAEVTCKKLTPDCPVGQVPEVEGSCWTGKCIATSECDHVSTCEPCKAAGLSCVTISTNSAFPIVHCVPLPAACKEATCACMGNTACSGSAKVCSDGNAGLTCSCPNC